MHFFKIKIVILTLAIRLKNIKSANNASKSNFWLIFNNININIKLYGKTIIKANKKIFNSILAPNNYIEILIFKKDCFLV